MKFNTHVTYVLLLFTSGNILSTHTWPNRIKSLFKKSPNVQTMYLQFETSLIDVTRGPWQLIDRPLTDAFYKHIANHNHPLCGYTPHGGILRYIIGYSFIGTAACSTIQLYCAINNHKKKKISNTRIVCSAITIAALYAAGWRMVTLQNSILGSIKNLFNFKNA